MSRIGASGNYVYIWAKQITKYMIQSPNSNVSIRRLSTDIDIDCVIPAKQIYH